MATNDEDKSKKEPPFGVFRPGPIERAARSFAGALPDMPLARGAASLLLGPAGGRRRRAYDVAIFGAAKARLHPYDNLCEKRVFLAPQFWDRRERALLHVEIETGGAPFVFVDVGANAGLYSLFVAAAARAAGRPCSIIAVEPEATMRARMAFNFAASEVEATILPYAATTARGPVRLAISPEKRGESRLVESGGETVEGAPLGVMLAEAGVSRIDAMKIDIEGHEAAALGAFFSGAPEALYPRLLIVETLHEGPDRPTTSLIVSRGYRVVLKTKLNTVFRREQGI